MQHSPKWNPLFWEINFQFHNEPQTNGNLSSFPIFNFCSKPGEAPSLEPNKYLWIRMWRVYNTGTLIRCAKECICRKLTSNFPNLNWKLGKCALHLYTSMDDELDMTFLLMLFNLSVLEQVALVDVGQSTVFCRGSRKRFNFSPMDACRNQGREIFLRVLPLFGGFPWFPMGFSWVVVAIDIMFTYFE